METTPITYIVNISSIIAAIVSLLTFYLVWKYQKINTIHAKATNLHEFINMSWSILNKCDIGSGNGGSKLVSCSSVENDMIKLRTLGIGITNSKIYSQEIHKTTEEIYKTFHSVFSLPCDYNEIKAKIYRLQYLYDNNLISK